MVWALLQSTRVPRKATRERRSSSEGSVISCVPRRATTTGMMRGRKVEMSVTATERLRGNGGSVHVMCYTVCVVYMYVHVLYECVVYMSYICVCVAYICACVVYICECVVYMYV